MTRKNDPVCVITCKDCARRGLTQSETARHLGVCRSTVNQIARRHDIRFLRYESKQWTEQQDLDLKDMHLQGESLLRIAAKLGKSQSAVRRRVRALGLKRDAGRAIFSLPLPDGVSRKTLHNKRWEAKYPEKRLAHKRVEVALRQGALERTPCEFCGAQEVHAHHDDYAQPLSVRWLCPPCHRKVHAA